MPYKFGEFVSTYVDPQSVAISETLRNRFMENFKANDQVSMAVDQMKAAIPFENDMAKKAELEKQVNEKLETLSARGDYENLGFAVHSTAKDFSKQYAPIKDNYDRYQSSLQGLQEQLKSGDINAEDFNLASGYIVKNYKGFEIDPTSGKVKEGTMFSAPIIYKDPKLMDKVKARLDILHENSTGQKVTSSGIDANGVYKVTSGGKVTEISEEQVLGVYNSVIQEPDVRMYLDQRSDMKLFAAEKAGSVDAIVKSKLDSNQAYIDKLTEQANSGKYTTKDKTIIQTQIEALKKENANIGKVMASPQDRDNYVRGLFKDELLAPVKSYALEKAYRETDTESSYENNYAFYIDAYTRRQNKLDALGENLQKMSDVYANNDISGSTSAQKQEYIVGQDAQIAITESKLQDASLSPDLRNELNSRLVNLKREKDRVQYQMKEAADKAISMTDLERQDPKLIATFKQMMPGASAGQIYEQLQKTFDNSGDQDYIEFQTAFDRQNGAGAFNNYISSNKFRKTPAVTKFSSEEKGMAAGMALAGQDYTYKEGYKDVLGFFKDKNESNVNSAYGEIKESRLYGERIQTGNDELDISTTKAVQAFFKDKPISENDTIIIDGELKKGKDLADTGFNYKVDKAFYNAGTNTYELSLVGKDGQVKTGLYDGRQIAGTGLAAAMSRPAVRLGAAVMEMNSHQDGNVREIKDVKFNGVPVTIKVISNGDANPYISILNDRTGKDIGGGNVEIKYKLDDAQLKELLESDVIITGL